MNDKEMQEILSKKAAAIKYNQDDEGAPILAAFGQGYSAEKIVSIAKESGVPVVEDSNAASMFSKMSIGDEIPPEMYEVVARILIFVSEVDRKYAI